MQEPTNEYFIKGAWIYSIPKELTEKEFIDIAGRKELMKYLKYPYVSLVLDEPKRPILIGHKFGNLIKLSLDSLGIKRYQTMEWKKMENVK